MSANEVIRNKRIELGMTMKELADKIGVSEAAVSPRGVRNRVRARQMRKKAPHSDTSETKHPFIR